MHPYLFSLPIPFLDEPFHLRSFGVLVACGFLFGAQVLQRLVELCLRVMCALPDCPDEDLHEGFYKTLKKHDFLTPGVESFTLEP